MVDVRKAHEHHYENGLADKRDNARRARELKIIDEMVEKAEPCPYEDKNECIPKRACSAFLIGGQKKKTGNYRRNKCGKTSPDSLDTRSVKCHVFLIVVCE